jgi:rhodanese-related sulfurtransferase
VPLGHIPGARNIPVGELPTSLAGREEMKKAPIVLV